MMHIAYEIAAAVLDNGIRCTDSHCRVRRSLRTPILASEQMKNAFLTDLRILPWTKVGQLNGFRIYAVRPQSLAARIGILNGDVLKGVDGTLPKKIAELGQSLGKLAASDGGKLQLARRGADVEIEIVFD